MVSKWTTDGTCTNAWSEISYHLNLDTSILYFSDQSYSLGRPREAREDILLWAHSEVWKSLYGHAGWLWHLPLRPLAPALLHSQGCETVTVTITSYWSLSFISTGWLHCSRSPAPRQERVWRRQSLHWPGRDWDLCVQWNRILSVERNWDIQIYWICLDINKWWIFRPCGGWCLGILEFLAVFPELWWRNGDLAETLWQSSPGIWGERLWGGAHCAEPVQHSNLSPCTR